MKTKRDYLNLAIAIANLNHEDVKRAKRLGIDERVLLGMARSCEREKWKLPTALFLRYCEENKSKKISVNAFLKKMGLTKKDVINMKKKRK